MKLKTSFCLLTLTGMMLLSSCANEENLLTKPIDSNKQVSQKVNTSGFIKPNSNSALNKLKAKLKSSPNSIKTFSTAIKLLPVDTNFKYEDKMWYLRKTNTYDAWKYTQGNKDLIVAVIDSGVDYNHPDLKDHVIKGPDFADKDNDPMDVGSHGTHVAGIIAGNGNMMGVAPNVKIMALKVFGDKDQGASFSDMATAIRYAVKNKASIINLSIGSASIRKERNSNDFDSAINEAIANGVNVVTAAGNSGFSAVNKPNVNEIPVVATDENDRLAGFTNYSNQELPKTISAPGQNIFSTVLTKNCKDVAGCDASYDFKDGTSMASPFVAGTLALIKSAMYDDYVRVSKELGSTPVSLYEFFHSKKSQVTTYLGLSLPPSQLAEALMSSCTNKYNNQSPYNMIYESQRDPVYGYGRVDVGAATQAAAKVFSSYFLADE